MAGSKRSTPQPQHSSPALPAAAWRGTYRFAARAKLNAAHPEASIHSQPCTSAGLFRMQPPVLLRAACCVADAAQESQTASLSRARSVLPMGSVVEKTLSQQAGAYYKNKETITW